MGLSLNSISFSQTTIISAIGDGGFETGSTFALNNWITNNPAQATRNQWVCNTGATTGFTGVRCAYISDNATGTPPHTYTVTTSRASHFYRNITVPAGETDIKLSFSWIGIGEGTFDKLRIWAVPTTYTPVYGTAIPTVGTAPSGNIQIGGNFSAQNSWTTANLTLPTAYAGTTFRLVFEWTNDASLGTQPPTAIDNISLTSQVLTAPINATCATATNLPCGTSNLAGTTVGTTGLIPNTSGCTMSNYGVWYTFVGDGQQTTISTNPSFDIKLSVSTGTCGSLTNIVCTDTAPETATFTTISGTVYYIYIAYWLSGGTTTGTFTISRTCTAAPVPPSNATCATATNLPCGTTNLAGTTVNTSSITNGTGCSMGDYGVWYSFVGDGYPTTISSTATFDHEMAITSGNCGSLTNISCNDVGLSGGTESYTFTSVIGTTYYIYISHYANGNNTTGTFTISRSCVSCIAPTVTAPTNVTTTSATINWNATTPAPAVGYQYVVSTSNTTPTGSGTATTATTANITGLTPDTTYYIFVRSDCGGGNFSTWSSISFTTGYCLSNNTTNSTYYIDNFSTSGGYNNITNNNSGFSVNGYGNFTAQSVSQINSASVSFSTSFFDGTYTYGFNIWVDWNNNFSFNDPGELVYASGAYVSFASGSFVVPASASIGNHRMRIVANYLSTNPSSCGTSSYSETEDYTFTVLSPLPCSGNPSNISVTATSQTTAVVNWTNASPEPVNGYQYYLSTSNTSPSPSTIPTGTTAAGVTTINLSGLTSNGNYYIWIRSDCGGGLGQGAWIGPVFFHQPNCSLGSGLGISSLGCPNVDSGGLGLNGADPAPISSCSSSACVDLEATYLHVGQPTSYTVQSIPYNPPYQYNCLRNPVSVNVDDVWSQPINLPFNFCFYGANYNQCLISSNGAITFNLTNNVPGGYSTWSFNNNVPSNTLFLNSIFGVYHDIDPSIGGEVGWELVTLASGCRALVASWNNIPMFSSTCNSMLYTGMIVLYENTNVIEVYVKEKNVCASWNAGNALIGIQNNTGTVGTVAPNRNSLDADWTTTNEAWRFLPSGTSVTSIKWYEGVGTSGPIVGTTDVINVCPPATTTYTAEVTYSLCSGTTMKRSESTTVTVLGNKTWNGSVNTDWNIANNWSPTGIPNATDCVIIPITANDPIVSGTNYNALAGNLRVLNNATLTINSNNNITVTDWINVQPLGTFQLNNTSNLVQINNTTNTGNIVYKRDASVRNLDYVYWSSPVTNFNVTNIASPLVLGPTYRWNPTLANPNGGQGYWENASGNSMILGKGYIARAPSSFSPTINSTLNGSFNGVPNNGTITIPISRGNDVNTAFHTGTNGTEITNFSDNWNLVGNPYPSSIRASQFLFDNNTKIEGNINLWTHGNLPIYTNSPFYQSFLYNYTSTDYITYNFTGTTCCPAASSDLFIGAGQGFFIQMKDGPTASDFVTFNNNLRNSTYPNNLFFRASSHLDQNQDLTNIERNRIWLDILNSDNVSNRTLVGYIEGATMGRDSFFDSPISVGSDMIIYSLIGQNKFNIQGRALPFDITDEIPMGVNIISNGNYSIAIAGVDGFFDTQNIYLKDELLNIIYDIKNSPYHFSAISGTFNDRFKIVYHNNTLNSNNYNANNNINITSNENVTVHSSNRTLKSISIFNILGQKIKEYDATESNTIILSNLQKNNELLLLKIELMDGSISNQKVIY